MSKSYNFPLFILFSCTSQKLIAFYGTFEYQITSCKKFHRADFYGRKFEGCLCKFCQRFIFNNFIRDQNVCFVTGKVISFNPRVKYWQQQLSNYPHKTRIKLQPHNHLLRCAAHKVPINWVGGGKERNPIQLIKNKRWRSIRYVCGLSMLLQAGEGIEYDLKELIGILTIFNFTYSHAHSWMIN